MTSSLLPVLILGFVIVSYIALRPFPSRVRYLFDFVCFVGATFILLRHQTLPLPGNGEAANASSLWLHAVAGIWWLLGARLLVAVMSFTLNYNRRWREARLFPDLTAAAIYAAAVLVVLISVLALPIGGLLATSGVLAIVLGLALQNTLADVFAGIAFGIEAPFNVGDRISLGDKIEGTVVQMNWRSIRILTVLSHPCRRRSPPKGGLLAMDKPMKLHSHEYRDKFSGTRRRVPPLSAGGSVVVHGVDAVLTGWLRRRALAQYSRLVFSVLDGLRAGGSCLGTRGPRNFQGLRNARGTTRPLGRHAGDWLCRHLRHVVDLAVVKKCL